MIVMGPLRCGVFGHDFLRELKQPRTGLRPERADGVIGKPACFQRIIPGLWQDGVRLRVFTQHSDNYVMERQRAFRGAVETVKNIHSFQGARLQAGFFQQFPLRRLKQCFSGFNPAAGKPP